MDHYCQCVKILSIVILQELCKSMHNCPGHANQINFAPKPSPCAMRSARLMVSDKTGYKYGILCYRLHIK